MRMSINDFVAVRFLGRFSQSAWGLSSHEVWVLKVLLKPSPCITKAKFMFPSLKSCEVSSATRDLWFESFFFLDVHFSVLSALALTTLYLIWTLQCVVFKAWYVLW